MLTSTLQICVNFKRTLQALMHITTEAKELSFLFWTINTKHQCLIWTCVNLFHSGHLNFLFHIDHCLLNQFAKHHLSKLSDNFLINRIFKLYHTRWKVLLCLHPTNFRNKSLWLFINVRLINQLLNMGFHAIQNLIFLIQLYLKFPTDILFAHDNLLCLLVYWLQLCF